MPSGRSSEGPRRRADASRSSGAGTRGSRSQTNRSADPRSRGGGPASSGSGRRRLAIAGIAALAVILGLVAYALHAYTTVGSKVAPAEEEREQIEAVLDAPEDADDDRFRYVLLLGNDMRPGETAARTDTILLARLDRQENSVILISIPRDTRTEVPGHGVTKINHASAYGGVPLAVDTVKQFTGLPVHHYVQIDFEGFEDLVDALGGVDMYVEAPVSYGQGVTVPAGMQHLDGGEALSVVRNRKAYAEGDLARVRTQRAFLSAVARGMASSRNLARLPSIMNGAADHIETDLGVGEIVGLVREYGDAAAEDIPGYTVPGSPQRIDGISYVIPDEEKADLLFSLIREGETPAE